MHFSKLVSTYFSYPSTLRVVTDPLASHAAATLRLSDRGAPQSARKCTSIYLSLRVHRPSLRLSLSQWPSRSVQVSVSWASGRAMQAGAIEIFHNESCQAQLVPIHKSRVLAGSSGLCTVTVIICRVVIWASDARMSPCWTSPKSLFISRPRVRGVNDCRGELGVLDRFTIANISCTEGALVETNNVSLS
jgi:hypothetical protein